MCTITKRPYSAVSMIDMPLPRSISPEEQEEAPVTRSLPLKKRRRLVLDLSCDGRVTPSTEPALTGKPSSMKKTKKAKKSVSFAPNASVRPVPKWTREEYTAAWYNGIDISLFKLQEGTDAALLRALLSNAPCVQYLPQDTSVYRGLERLLSPQITSEIKERRRTVVKCVLFEQALQRQQGICDVNRIGNVSKCCTEKASIWALTLGSLV